MNGGTYRRPAHIAVVDSAELPSMPSDMVMVAHLEAQFIAVLEGTASLVWRVAEGPADGLAERAAAASGLQPDLIGADVESFAADLVGRGLLARDPA